MMDKHLSYLITEFNERKKMLQDALAYGHCQSYEEYKYVCGQLRGLEAASGITEDLKKRLENSDE